MGVTGEGVFPLVSIVTPCYNMARYVEETVQSVLDQDYPNIEYIIQDAGSTDGTVEILKKYEEKARVYSEPDNGTADAVNRGFQRSRGSVLAFLNADDYYFPGAVSRAVRTLVAHPEVAMVYGRQYDRQVPHGALRPDAAGRGVLHLPADGLHPPERFRRSRGAGCVLAVRFRLRPLDPPGAPPFHDEAGETDGRFPHAPRE